MDTMDTTDDEKKKKPSPLLLKKNMDWWRLPSDLFQCQDAKTDEIIELQTSQAQTKFQQYIFKTDSIVKKTIQRVPMIEREKDLLKGTCGPF